MRLLTEADLPEGETPEGLEKKLLKAGASSVRTTDVCQYQPDKGKALHLVYMFVEVPDDQLDGFGEKAPSYLVVYADPTVNRKGKTVALQPLDLKSED